MSGVLRLVIGLLMAILILAISLLVSAGGTETVPAFEALETCFLTGERVSGMNKICYYECVAGDIAITVSHVALCPLSLPE